MSRPQGQGIMGGRAKAPAKLQRPQAPAPPVEWYRVLEDRQVPRGAVGGQGSYMLKQGKEIPSSSYPIAELLRAGAKLEKMEGPPRWWLDQQRAALENEDDETRAAFADILREDGPAPTA
jgi:hypothetical protein